ncbi:MAG: hypothetical protein Q9187_008166 [Circinaria calcarea]
MVTPNNRVTSVAVYPVVRVNDTGSAASEFLYSTLMNMTADINVIWVDRTRPWLFSVSPPSIYRGQELHLTEASYLQAGVILYGGFSSAGCSGAHLLPAALAHPGSLNGFPSNVFQMRLALGGTVDGEVATECGFVSNDVGGELLST